MRALKKRKGHIRMGADKAAFNAISYAFIVIAASACLLPFLMIISGSFTAEESIYRDGFRLIPKVFSLEAYKILLKSPDTLINAYAVTIAATLAGTFLGLFFTSMTAYVLLRKDFPWRNQFAFFFFFTTLFSGGLVPWYILMVQYLKLKDNPIVLVLPGLFSVFYILIMRNFMKSIPEALIESAKIDGAGDFYMYLRIILPLSGPSLATIGLFIALDYWSQSPHS
ncbi:MAG: carbohydrate ABC transporter permease [Clostridiales bacterium]|jgi:putative aldouronate transport system permease protein|nr:carbohydrate ABC transporter permease [Clostridiales bacterium]